MIEKAALTQFLSGRLLGLCLLLGFQVMLVRLLPAPDYARYALVIAAVGLLQTVTSFGLPRVAAKFLSGAGEIVTRQAARTLMITMLACRALVCITAVVLAAMLGPAQALPLIWAAGAYALATALQVDADGVAQALKLQIASRRAAVGEPLARVLGIASLALMRHQTSATTVVVISAATAGAASAMLIGACLIALFRGVDAPQASTRLDWPDIRSVALGGYGGTLSWLTFSPAVIRLIASRVLPLEAFAGFSFVQALVVSAQRYAPSFMLFPLVEPAAMADQARTGRADRLIAALSLLVKIDAAVVGAGLIGLAPLGAMPVLVLTHGRYGAAAVFLPWLLLGVVANASHRAYEIAAVGVGAAGALGRSFGLTLGWLVATLLLTPMFGVWSLLLCPLGDAFTRFWFVQRALTKRGAADLIDVKGLALIAGLAAAFIVADHALGETIPGTVERLGVGVMAGIAFLMTLAICMPIRTAERTLLLGAFPGLGRIFTPSKSQKPLRVTILTPRGRGGSGGVDRLMDSLRPLFATQPDLVVRFLTTRGVHGALSPLIGALAVIRLAAACALRRTDLIHVNLGANGSCYRKMALLLVPRFLGTPYVLHLHGSAFETFWAQASPWSRRSIDRLFLDAAHVIVLGEHWRCMVADRLPDRASRLVVLANASPPFNRLRGPQQSEVQLLFLGEIGGRKGSPILIEALGRLETKAAWRAVIAGDGDVAAARLSVNGLGLSQKVALPGWVGPKEVEALLSAADILVLPSFEENLPMAVIEAFAAGLAVIATPVGALPDILRHQHTGLVVRPGDVGDLTAALRVLVDDPDLRRRLGDAAQAYHAKHLSIGTYKQRLSAVWSAASGI